jgi:hypothetical protein
MKQHNLKSFNGFEKTNRSVGHLFSFLLPQMLNWKRNVVLAYNLRIGATPNNLLRLYNST